MSKLTYHTSVFLPFCGFLLFTCAALISVPWGMKSQFVCLQMHSCPLHEAQLVCLLTPDHQSQTGRLNGTHGYLN
jgi:hypothetical protein